MYLECHFETYVKKNIFDPLGMDRSSFIYPEIPDSLRVSGHVWAGRPIVSNVYPYNRIHAPSSTLNSNVIDMTHYAMANLNRGKYKNVQILSDTTYDLLWTNSVNLKDKPNVGAGWFLDQYKGLKAIRHSGGDTGFRSFLLLVPEKNIAVMLVSNYEMCPTNDIAYAVLDMLLGEKPKEMKRHIGFSFAEVLVKEGPEKAKAFYINAKADSTQHRYYLWNEDDEALTYPGYVLLEQKMLDEALEVFRFNLEINPQSGYAYGHFGVAYANTGKRDLAKRNLQKAIDLVPSEEYFKDELKKLEASR
jgi:CubicO group peptidase (beta-lactamase class C family)